MTFKNKHHKTDIIMKTKQITLITLLLLAFASTTFAQGFIEGTVYEEAENGKRTPLPGVNVYWKSSTKAW